MSLRDLAPRPVTSDDMCPEIETPIVTPQPTPFVPNHQSENPAQILADPPPTSPENQIAVPKDPSPQPELRRPNRAIKRPSRFNDDFDYS